MFDVDNVSQACSLVMSIYRIIFTFFAAERNQQTGKGSKGAGVPNATTEQPTTQPEPTWVHEIFQGILTSETRCLNCETVCGLICCIYKYADVELYKRVWKNKIARF